MEASDEDVNVDEGRDGNGATFCVSQAVLDLPAGRYTIDATDARTGAVLSRESAASPPLVVGVPRRARGVLLQIAAAAAVHRGIAMTRVTP